MRILCEFAQVERGEKMNTKTKYEVYIEGDWLTNYRDEKVETVEQAKRHAEFISYLWCDSHVQIEDLKLTDYEFTFKANGYDFKVEMC
jgi:hypothetical protein